MDYIYFLSLMHLFFPVGGSKIEPTLFDTVKLIPVISVFHNLVPPEDINRLRDQFFNLQIQQR